MVVRRLAAVVVRTGAVHTAVALRVVARTAVEARIAAVVRIGAEDQGKTGQEPNKLFSTRRALRSKSRNEHIF